MVMAKFQCTDSRCEPHLHAGRLTVKKGGKMLSLADLPGALYKSQTCRPFWIMR